MDKVVATRKTMETRGDTERDCTRWQSWRHRFRYRETHGDTKYRETRNFVKTQKHCRFPNEGKHNKQ
jgi:hypothetical protein